MFFFRHTRAIEIGKSKIQLKTIIYNGWQLAPCPIHFPEMNLGNWQVQCIFSFISSINEEVDRSLLFCDLLISLPSCVLRLVSDTQFAYSYPPGSHGLQGLISPSWWCLKALFILWRPILSSDLHDTCMYLLLIAHHDRRCSDPLLGVHLVVASVLLNLSPNLLQNAWFHDINCGVLNSFICFAICTS